MSVSGIVRRMDELGRIVIPKELRKTLRLREGDEMEIFPDGDGLYVRRHSGFSGFERAAEATAKFLHRKTGCNVIVAAGGVVVAAAGEKLRATVGRKLESGFDSAYCNREKRVVTGGAPFVPVDGVTVETSCAVVIPVVAAGDVPGVLLCFGNDAEKYSDFFGLAAEMLGAALEQ